MVGCLLIEQIGIACERANDLALSGQPLVLTRADQSVLVLSDEASKAGVRVGHALTAARLLCPAVLDRLYDEPAYLDAAEVVWDALAIESSYVEPCGPECCFIELNGQGQESRMADLARTISNVIGVEVKACLASSRFVAECAARSAPAGAVVVVNAGDEAWTLSHCRLRSIPGVDIRSVERLEKLGLHTIGELFDVGERRLPKTLQGFALTLMRRSQGFDSAPVQPLWPPRAEAARVTFDDEVADLGRIEAALRQCAAEIAARLAGGFTYARQLALIVGLPNAEGRTLTEETGRPVADAVGLFRAALRLWSRLAITNPVVELRLEARRIAAPRSVQLSLLDGSGSDYLPHEREQRLAAGTRFLNRRFGPSAVAQLGTKHDRRRIDLWTYPLGHIADEPVIVKTGSDGAPEFVARGGRPVRHVTLHDQWTESAWSMGVLVEHDVYRVFTDDGALWQLQCKDDEWRLAGLVD